MKYDILEDIRSAIKEASLDELLEIMEGLLVNDGRKDLLDEISKGITGKPLSKYIIKDYDNKQVVAGAGNPSTVKAREPRTFVQPTASVKTPGKYVNRRTKSVQGKPAKTTDYDINFGASLNHVREDIGTSIPAMMDVQPINLAGKEMPTKENRHKQKSAMYRFKYLKTNRKTKKVQ